MVSPAVRALLGAGDKGSESLPVEGATLWWDFSDETTITIATGISQVDDKSGNLNHGVQTTSTARPSHTNTTNLGGGARKVARFDGADDHLLSTSNAMSAPSTLFYVMYKRTMSEIGGDADMIIALHGHSIYISGVLQCWNGSGAETLENVPQSGWTEPLIHVWTQSTSTYSYWIGGANKKTNSALGNDLDTGVSLGGTPCGDWDVGEVICFPSVLSASDINLIGNYLETKWGPNWSNI